MLDDDDPGRFTNESSISKTALAFSSVNLFFDGDHCDVHIPVVGGHSGMTIVPLLSKISSPYNFTQDQISSLTNHIQFGGDEVVKAKDNTGSATLPMAYTINLDADQRRATIPELKVNINKGASFMIEKPKL
nr:10766_t:CDS:2 [Entrophospora candida]